MDEVKTLTPLQAMILAIEEAKKGFGFVSPNPPVGCVILDKNYHFLASGYHQKLGADHAEIMALKKIDSAEKLRGAHVFVTLEPCSHEGRTPSCAKALAKLPISSVTYGLKDPNPLVSGKGLEILQQAGIDVQCVEGLKQDLENLAEIFLLNMKQKKCFIALKVASSIDGQIALTSGESQWITSETARNKGQWLRGYFDATAVGLGTFLKDDPSLNVRHKDYLNKKNHKVVIFDREAQSLRELPKAKLLKYNSAENIYIVINDKFEDKISNPSNVNLIYVKHDEHGPVLEDLHEKLFQNEIYSLYVEGGAKVLSYFITQKAFHSLYVFLGAKLLGKGLSWTKELEFSSLSDALSLKLSHYEILENDILLKYRL